MKRKIISALLATVTAFTFVLTGCGSAETSSDSGKVSITNVSYDPTREFYSSYNDILEKDINLQKKILIDFIVLQVLIYKQGKLKKKNKLIIQRFLEKN